MKMHRVTIHCRHHPDPQHVKCPFCSAAPGRPCVTPEGNAYTNRHHVARVDLAIEEEEQMETKRLSRED